MSDSAEIRLGDQNFECPIVVGSEGERAIDVQEVRAIVEDGVAKGTEFHTATLPKQASK